MTPFSRALRSRGAGTAVAEARLREGAPDESASSASVRGGGPFDSAGGDEWRPPCESANRCRVRGRTSVGRLRFEPREKRRERDPRVLGIRECNLRSARVTRRWRRCPRARRIRSPPRPARGTCRARNAAPRVSGVTGRAGGASRARHRAWLTDLVADSTGSVIGTSAVRLVRERPRARDSWSSDRPTVLTVVLLAGGIDDPRSPKRRNPSGVSRETAEDARAVSRETSRARARPASSVSKPSTPRRAQTRRGQRAGRVPTSLACRRFSRFSADQRVRPVGWLLEEQLRHLARPRMIEIGRGLFRVKRGTSP